MRIGLEAEEVEGIIYTAAKNPDGSIAVVVFNKNEENYALELALEESNYTIQIGPRTMQTIHLQAKKPNE